MLSRKYVTKEGKTRYEYFRICPECEDQSWVSYKPKSNMVKCPSCAKQELAKNMHKANVKQEHEKIKYKRVCVDCGNVKMLANKPLAPKSEQRCGTCSRVKTGKSNAKIYTRTCIICGDTKQVQGKNASKAKYCAAHKHLGVNHDEVSKQRKKTLEKNGTKTGRKKMCKTLKKSGKVSQQAIDRARAINKEHRDSLDTKEVKVIPRATMSDEEMVKEWLKKNKPTVKEFIEYEPWYTGLKVNGQSSVW
jgi:hypothetical protein